MRTAARTFALNTVELKGVEIFDVGTWNGDPYTDAQLDEMVTNTMTLKAKGLLEPPVKIGHANKQSLLEAEGLPAAGWIDRVYRVGTKVVADLSHVPAKIGELVQAGAYRKVSAEIWPKFGKAPDGVTYGYVLKAIAFLGGEIPAVPTLADIAKLYGLADVRAVRAYAAAQQREVVVFESGNGDDDDPEAILLELERASERARARAKGRKGAPRARAILDEALTKLRALMGTANLSDDNDDVDELAIDTGKCPDCQHAYAAHGGNVCAMAGCDCTTKAPAANAKEHAAHSLDTAGGEPPMSELAVHKLPPEAFADGTTFPHHHVRGGTLYTHAGAVRAAMTAIAGGAKASDAAKAHIAQHAAKLGITSEARKNTEGDMDKDTLAKLGLADDATPEQIKAKIDELTTTAGKFAEAERELNVYAEERKLGAAKDKVRSAMTARKIAPRQEAWATDYAAKDPEGFDAYVKAAPEIFSDSRGQAGGENVVDAGDDPSKALDLLARKAMADDKALTYGEAIRRVSADQPALASKYARSAPAARSN